MPCLVRNSSPLSLLLAPFLLLLIAVAAFRVEAQEADPALKEQAYQLYKQGKYVDALPLFEKLNSQKPGDPALLEAYSYCTFEYSATLTDPAARKAARIKTRKLALEAQAAGDKSNLLSMALEIPEDGGDTPFASGSAVDETMSAGEAAFAKGDYESAIAAYQKALDLDPHQYHAALFIGDVYFKKDDHDQAAKWFLRAIQIDPNIETAYRYWGDDLMAQGRVNDAKVKFVQAVVAEPYNNHSWMGLSQWAKKENAALANPPINPPGKVEDKGKDSGGKGQINIMIDPATMGKDAEKTGTNAWFIYNLSKASWHGDRFQKEFPNEKQYRHSLAEEVDGYQLVVDQVREGLKEKKIKQLDPGLADLVKLSDQQLLEPFVLISKADAGIAIDYPTYRDAHRDKVAEYINNWIIHAALSAH